jgi:hypothetical protein
MKKNDFYGIQILKKYSVSLEAFEDYLRSVATYISTYVVNSTVSYVELKRLIARQRAVFNGKNDARYIKPASFENIETFANALNISDSKLAALAACAHDLSIGSSNAASTTIPFLKYLTDSKLFQIINPESRSIILKSIAKPDDRIAVDLFNLSFVAHTRRNKTAE